MGQNVLPMHVSAVVLAQWAYARVLHPLHLCYKHGLVYMQQRLHDMMTMDDNTPAVQLLLHPVQCGCPTGWVRTSAHASAAATVASNERAAMSGATGYTTRATLRAGAVSARAAIHLGWY
jgi:hypothetical protein